MNWGLGIGDWGLGIGDWAQSPIPNPQSPIKNICLIIFELENGGERMQDKKYSTILTSPKLLHNLSVYSKFL